MAGRLTGGSSPRGELVPVLVAGILGLDGLGPALLEHTVAAAPQRVPPASVGVVSAGAAGATS